MMTAKPQCYPQCFGVECYITPFFCTQHIVCPGQNPPQWQQFLAAHKWWSSSTEAVLFKKTKTKDELPYYIQLTKLSYEQNTNKMMMKHWKPGIEIQKPPMNGEVVTDG